MTSIGASTWADDFTKRKRKGKSIGKNLLIESGIQLLTLAGGLLVLERNGQPHREC
jgi:hypothetical protein